MNDELNELTRQGKNICKGCDKPKLMYICKGCDKSKLMYYIPWCPRCEKPDTYKVSVLNFIKCLDHLEAIGNEGIKERVWKYLIDSGSIAGNDTHFVLYFEEEYDEDNITKQMFDDLNTIKSVYNLGESVMMFVSW